MMNGFLFTRGNTDYFLPSDGKNITKKVAINMITGVAEHIGAEPETLDSFIKSEVCIKELQYRISKATLEVVDLKTTSCTRISGKNFCVSYPKGDDSLVILSRGE